MGFVFGFLAGLLAGILMLISTVAAFVAGLVWGKSIFEDYPKQYKPYIPGRAPSPKPPETEEPS